MMIADTTQWPHSRAKKTVEMVQLTLRHRDRTHVIVIEHHELSDWICCSRAHGLSLEAKSIGPSEVGMA
ncbi:MAG: hypothetical protein HW392_2269 [Steroidobacteraceae bacterium]|nr:hypothetical protein [Steroidobacteraceae bacterium]